MYTQPVYQMFEFDCGCSCSYYVCKYFNIDNLPAYPAFLSEIGSSFLVGTNSNQIIKILTKFGISVSDRQSISIEELRNNCKQGNIIICATQSENEIGHWVVVMGVNLPARLVYLMDPLKGFVEVSLYKFVELWYDTNEKDEVLTRYGIICRKVA